MHLRASTSSVAILTFLCPHSVRTFFSKYDRDGGGCLGPGEFRKAVRQGMKISTKDLPDEDIDTLIKYKYAYALRKHRSSV